MNPVTRSMDKAGPEHYLHSLATQTPPAQLQKGGMERQQGESSPSPADKTAANSPEGLIQNASTDPRPRLGL